MKNFVSATVSIFFAFLIINCENDDPLRIRVEPEEETITVEPYHVMVSKYYDSLFVSWYNTNTIQDFDIFNHVIYIWPYGAIGFFEYHLDTEKLVFKNAGSGDYITADSGRVLLGMAGSDRVMAYYLEDNSYEWFVTKDGHYGVNGLQVYNGKLYVLYDDFDNRPNGNVIDSYNLTDGKLVESLSYPRFTISLSIKDNIAYSTEYVVDSIAIDGFIMANPSSCHSEITRFNMTTGEFLENVEAPAVDCASVRCWGDYFFFTDHDNKYIGYVTLEEINAHIINSED
jgi:outer membrane protein assembly factor BamB